MDPHERERAAMVQRLAEGGYARDPRVLDAMRRVPRHLFLPGHEHAAYVDRPVGIGEGQTISAPHMVALMAEALDARPGMRVLEVGAGSGYHAAVVAELVGPGGGVVSVERYPDLAAQARANLGHAGLGPSRVEVVEGDGSEGWAPRAPYDRAYLTCAAPRVPPPLLAQVAPGGLILAPVGDRYAQELVRVRVGARGEAAGEERLGGCVFVPLVGRHGFPETRWN